MPVGKETCAMFLYFEIIDAYFSFYRGIGVYVTTLRSNHHYVRTWLLVQSFS
nr:DUF475 domain-containing protein [Lactococcus lactis]